MTKTASILSIGGFRRLTLLKPLAILIAMLMLPPELPFLGKLSFMPKANAQITVCPPGQSKIFQSCPNADTSAFEAEGLQDFEKFYNLTPGDGQKIYTYGRADMRMDFRAFLYNKLLNAIRDPGNQTVAEQNMVGFLQGVLQQHEIALYQAAVNDRDLFLNHYCQWQPDFDIQGAYDAYMSTLAYCGSTVTALPPIFGGSPDLPTKDYFTTLGYKKVYVNGLAAVWPEPASAELQLSTAQVAEIASIAAGGAAIGGTATGLIVKYKAKIFPNAKKGISINKLRLQSQISKLKAAGKDTAELEARLADLGEDFTATGLTASRVLGPIGIALVLATIIIGAILAAEAAKERQETLNGLNNDLSHAQSTRPDLSAWADSDEGLDKIRSVFLELTGPEYPSSTALPTPAATDPQFVTNSASLTNQVGPISFQDNLGTNWTAQPYGRNWFVQTGIDSLGHAVTRFGNGLTYLNSVNGVKTAYKATMNEGFFFIAKLSLGDNDQVCPPDTTGVYTGPTANCHSYSSNALQMLDANNNPVTITLTQAVGFDSTPYAAFTAGNGGSVTVTAHGIPAPDFTVLDSTPAGLTYSNSTTSPGMRSVQINISPSMGPQSFTFHLLFSNASSTISVPFKVDIDTVVHITSPNTLAMTYGQPVNFTVTATGTPVSLSIAPALLPNGVTAQDNGNGTMTISGTPILDANQSTVLLCIDPLHSACGITASNAVSQDFEVFHTSIAIPPISITSANNITFYGGQPNSFQITMSGAQVTPGHSIAQVADACHLATKPSWLTETVLPSGDMVLSGTPPFNTGAIAYSTEMVVFVNGGIAGLVPVCGVLAPNFTLTVVSQPLFSPINYLVALPGLPVPTTPFVTGNPIDIFTIDGTVPTGVLEQHTLNSFNFAGTVPVATNAGDYPLTITSTVGTISGSQKFHFIVGQAPHDDGFKVFNLVINQPGKVVINPAGFPKRAIDSVPAMTSIFHIDPPPGMQIVSGPEDGSVELVGTPTQLFQRSAPFTSDNGVAPELIEVIQIRVINPGDINADGHVDCADVSMVKAALNTRLGFAGYSNLADVNNDGIVNAQDLALVAKYLTQGTRCQ